MDRKIPIITKIPVNLWNNNGNDYTIEIRVQEYTFRLDMEIAYEFAYLLEFLGCDNDPTGYYTSADLENYDTSVSLDLPRTQVFIQDSIYLERQLDGGCYLEFIRQDIINNHIQKAHIILNAEECDYLYLQIIEL